MNPNADLPRMPARYFAILCDLLSADGTDVAALLQAAGIWPTQIHGPDATLTTHQFESFVAAVERSTGRNDLGFVLGRQIKLSSHEILGYAILTCPTLDAAIHLASRYYRLITPAFRMEYRRGDVRSEIRFQPMLPLAPQAMRFLLETVVVSTHEQLKSLMQGSMPMYDVDVSYTEPRHAEHYRELRPARFHFGTADQAALRMVLDTSLLSMALPMADRSALQMAESQCQQLMLRTRESRRMAEWVTMMLRESANGFPSLAELAELLNQSPRTLDRNLQREGYRFLELSKRIRHEKACEMLRAGRQPITQIAYQLGYSEVAAFSRAFRRESGTSPAAFANREGSDPAD